MSIFDTLKYPITEEFKYEDLRRIPKEILVKWWVRDMMKVKLFQLIARTQGYGPNIGHIWDMMLFNPDIRKKSYELLSKRIARL